MPGPRGPSEKVKCGTSCCLLAHRFGLIIEDVKWMSHIDAENFRNWIDNGGRWGCLRKHANLPKVAGRHVGNSDRVCRELGNLDSE